MQMNWEFGREKSRFGSVRCESRDVQFVRTLAAVSILISIVSSLGGRHNFSSHAYDIWIPVWPLAFDEMIRLPVPSEYCASSPNETAPNDR
jgi:hypothetical protein